MEFNAGEERNDRRTALLAALLHNANRRKGTTPKKVSDFMPKRKEQAKKKPQQSVDQMIAMARAITEAMGGKIISREAETVTVPEN